MEFFIGLLYLVGFILLGFAILGIIINIINSNFPDDFPDEN